MRSEQEFEYLFNGIEIKQTIAGIGNSKKLFLKAQAYFDGVLIDLRVPISQKSFDEHAGQQLALLTQELLRRAIQEEPLREWLQSQSDHSRREKA